jgi:hypothetical protein
LKSFSNVRDYSQIKHVYKLTQDVIENLDEFALNEIFGGNEKDIDSILDIIAEETDRVLFENVDVVKVPTFNYLERLTENVDETLRKLNITYFISNVMSDFELNWHHIEWGSFVQLYNWLGIEASRDSGKSYYYSNAYPIWKMYRYERLPYKWNVPTEFSLSKLGMLITNEQDLVRHFLTIIRENVEGNDILREKLYPGKGKGWGHEEIVAKNGARLMTRSYGSSKRGYHPGYVVIDDYQNDNVLYSSEQRDKYKSDFYGVIDNMLLKNGQIINVGTPFIEGDLWDVLKKDKRFRVFEYPSIYPNGELLWKSRHPLDELLAKKDAHGSLIFSREQLVKPITDGASIFPWDVLKRSFIQMENYVLVSNIQSFPIKFQSVVVGTDFAISSSIAADESVFTVWGWDGNFYWLIHISKGKGLEYDTQMAIMKQINNNFQPDLFVIESNQMQKIFYQMAIDAGLPCMEHQTGRDKYSLQEGLPGMAVIFEKGLIKLPRGDQNSIALTDELCNQLNSFSFDPDKKKLISLSQHDDMGMSAWQGLRGIRFLNNSFKFSFI